MPGHARTCTGVLGRARGVHGCTGMHRACTGVHGACTGRARACTGVHGACMGRVRVHGHAQGVLGRAGAFLRDASNRQCV